MKVILGITGSIAAYKALELVRLIRKNDGEVRVVLTRAALSFVTPLTCQTLADHEVYQGQFLLDKDKDIKHLVLSDWGDMLVVAPATANIIGKAASGIGDDLLSTTLLSYQKSILMVPAMDEGMWANKIVIDNVRKLKAYGYHFLEPAYGLLASGKIGRGRFPAADLIYKKILTVWVKKRMLTGKKVLITGGRTEEDLDPVRVITNRSSGRMALELFDAAACRECEVRLILGEAGTGVPDHADIVRVRTSAEMLHRLKQNIAWCDLLIMSAAVGDYRPDNASRTKIHSNQMKLNLVKNRDLLKEMSKYRGKKIFIGFSLEAADHLSRARHKLKSKNLDFIVANTASALGNDQTEARILSKNGKIKELGKLNKWDLAHKILDECFNRMKKPR